MGRPVARSKAFTEPLPGHIQDDLVYLANQAAPQEACGFIMYTTGMFILKCENVAKDPVRNFRINERDILRVFETEEHIVGMFHSHPRGPNRPSPTDLKYQGPPGIRYFIVTLTHVFEYDMEPPL
jgi:desampylase